jgi:hypothetical protein
LRFVWLAWVTGAVALLLFVLGSLAVPGAAADVSGWMTALPLAALAFIAARYLAQTECGKREGEAERQAWQLREWMAWGVFGLVLALYQLSMQVNLSQAQQSDLIGTILRSLLAAFGVWTAAKSLSLSLPLIRQSHGGQV